MAGITFSIPNTFAGIAGPTEPLSALDADFAAIQTALSGLVAALTDLPSAVNATGTRAWAKGADLASAATLNLGSDGNYFVVTGVVAITAISAKQAGCVIYLRFSGALTLTYNATNLILQGATNATTAAGDLYEFVSEGGGNWREVSRRVTTNATSAKFLSGVGTFLTPSGTALTFVGGNTTEGTTTSTTPADVVAVSSISVAVTSPVLIVGSYRKSAGFAAASVLQLKLNATSLNGGNTATSANNTAEDGAFIYYLAPQEATNYTHAVWGIGMTNQTTTLYNLGQPGGAGATPNATLTSITIQANSGNAAVTTAVKDVFVYSLATA